MGDVLLFPPRPDMDEYRPRVTISGLGDFFTFPPVYEDEPSFRDLAEHNMKQAEDLSKLLAHTRKELARERKKRFVLQRKNTRLAGMVRKLLAKACFKSSNANGEGNERDTTN